MSAATPPQPQPQQNGGRSQYLFTESDELRLLRSFQKIARSPSSPSSSSSPQSQQISSAAFRRLISALGSNFTQKQVNDKLRRLRSKYHKQARSKSLIKTPHDRMIFEIARQIWGKGTSATAEKTARRRSKRSKSVPEAPANCSIDGNDKDTPENRWILVNYENTPGNGSVDGNALGEEEEERGEGGNGSSDLNEYSALVAEFSRFFPDNSVWREGMKYLGESKLREMNEEWMQLRVEEAKLMAKRAELVEEQTKLVMDAVVLSSSKRN